MGYTDLSSSLTCSLRVVAVSVMCVPAQCQARIGNLIPLGLGVPSLPSVSIFPRLSPILHAAICYLSKTQIRSYDPPCSSLGKGCAFSFPLLQQDLKLVPWLTCLATAGSFFARQFQCMEDVKAGRNSGDHT